MRRAWSFTWITLIAVAVILSLSSPHNLTRAEGEAFWIIRDDLAWQVAPRDFARNLREDLRLLNDHLQEAQAVPLYFVTLDGWEIVAGESITAARWLSTLFVVLGLAGFVALMRKLPAEGVSVAFSVTAGAVMLLYVAGVACTYALLFSSTIFTALFWFQWVKSRRWRDGALTIAALLVVTATDPIMGRAVLFLPLITFREGLRFGALVMGVILLGFLILNPPIVHAQTDVLIPTLVSLWVLLAPIVIYGGARFVHRGGRPVLVLASLIVIGIAVNAAFLRERPDWGAMLDDLSAERGLLDSGVVVIDEQHPLMQIDRMEDSAWRWGMWVDLAWQAQTPESVQTVLDKLGAGDHWALIDMEHPNADTVLTALPEARVLVREVDGTALWRFGED